MADEQFYSTPDDIASAYRRGLEGVYADPAADEALWDYVKGTGGYPEARRACQLYGLENSGKGALSLPFMEIYKLYPDCLPGGSQQRGDCVSWSTRNACLGTMCCEVTSGKPDEVSGRLEGAPKVSREGIKYGVLSCEAIYNWRRHGGDGWSCGAAANVVLKESGLWLRKNYPEIGVNLSKYSGKNAGIYGRTTPPASWLAIGKDRLVRTATSVNSYEELRSMLANGYCISSCGSEAWESSRDENGVSRRRGSWAHALAYLGVDDRKVIIDLYGEPLVLVQNSWGEWNRGGTRIYKTNIDIPVGSFWSKWSDLKRRSMIAFSGVNGWPPNKLKDWGVLGKI